MNGINGPFIMPHTFELYAGPVKSSKTSGLIHRLGVLEHVSGCNFKVFKPSIDTRSDGLYTRQGEIVYTATAISEETPRDILNFTGGVHLVVIDEIQFFGKEIVPLIRRLMHGGLHVIAAGLDTDFRGEPFGSLADLLVLATDVHKLVGVCDYEPCKSPATMTQRLVDGKPDHYGSDVLAIDRSAENMEYQCRCLMHHEVPGMPEGRF